MDKVRSMRQLKLIASTALAIALGLALALTPADTDTALADEEHSGTASSTQDADVLSYGMTPISGDLIADGTWEIEMRSSSTFFKPDKVELIVENGEMTARLTMPTYSYTLLYMGTPDEAAAAPYDDYIEYEEVDGYYVFTIPVKALDAEIECAAWSNNRDKWYERTILFDATTLPAEALNGIELPDFDLIDSAVTAYEASGGGQGEQSAVSEQNATTDSSDTSTTSGAETSTSDTTTGDVSGAMEPAEAVDAEGMADGRYSVSVSISGGSGRASVSTPTLMIVKDGKVYAQLLWSSTYYDWMIVGGQRYENETTDGGNSKFTIPVTAFDQPISVIADTTAMGDPVAINYTLTFYQETIGGEELIPQEAAIRVCISAVVLIVVGFILNIFIKKKRKYR
jgi:hypothetical protein